MPIRLIRPFLNGLFGSEHGDGGTEVGVLIRG